MDNSIKENIDYNILIRIVIVSLAIIFSYMIFDLIIGIKKEHHVIPFIVISIWLIILFFVIKGKHIGFIKHFSISAMMLSTYMGFFVLNGIHGVSIIDFLNVLFIITILFDGFIRIFYLILHSLIITLLFYINFNHSDLIKNTYKNFNEIHLVFGYGIRMVNLLVIGSIMRNQFNKENTRTNQMNLQLKEQNDKLILLNEEIRKQSDELSLKNNYIKSINSDLEKEVESRTRRVFEQNKKLIDYAYFNSHKVRGPLARILGLSYLIRSDENIKKEELYQYVNLMDQNANELDTIVKNINSLLAEDKEINDSIESAE